MLSNWRANIFDNSYCYIYFISGFFLVLLWTILTMVIGLIYFIPIVLYIEIYGRIKFNNDADKPIEPLIENEQSKKQDIDD